MYDQEIFDEFIVEANELLSSAEEDILEIEGNVDKELVNRIFRAFHTVKGNASMLGLDKFASLAHHAEDTLVRVRNGSLTPGKSLVDLLLKVLDSLQHLLEDVKSGEDSRIDIEGLINALEDIYMQKNASQTEPEPTRPVAEEGKLRILVVEDDLTSREILRIMLSNYGEVDAVEDGRVAVETVRKLFESPEPEPYQLICMDIMMPELDGMEAVKQIREIEKNNGILPNRESSIIMTTALDDPKTVIRSLYKCGATAYLVKPVQKEPLEKELKKLELI